MKRKRTQSKKILAPGAWLQSYTRVSRHLAQWDLGAMLKDQGGLVKIPNFLPLDVAEHALSILQDIPATSWNATNAHENVANNDITHSFKSTKTGPGLQPLLRIFTLLYPDALNAFSAAKYEGGDHIAPHDDRAYTPVVMDDTKEIIQCSRDVAIIYYLTKGWNAEMGGVFRDLEGKKEFVPEFNSLVAFQVPRYHEVTAVAITSAPRYSIFGWTLIPGVLYELYSGEGDEEKGKNRKNTKGTRTKGKATFVGDGKTHTYESDDRN